MSDEKMQDASTVQSDRIVELEKLWAREITIRKECQVSADFAVNDLKKRLVAESDKVRELVGLVKSLIDGSGYWSAHDLAEMQAAVEKYGKD